MGDDVRESRRKQEEDLNNISSESTLVRLSINALQGTHSSITTLLTLSSHFRSSPSDRTHHSLFSRAASTHSLANILTSVSRAATSVHLLRTFAHSLQHPPCGLVSQAFAVVVGKILEGFLCGIDTVSASVALRRGKASVEEVTLLEVYLHTKELRVRIEALASICKLDCGGGGDFSVFELDDLVGKASSDFLEFPRGADLLTYLYDQLKFADPVHRALLKFLFLGSCEPYCRFIRSWVYEARISDPYEEFIIKDAPDNGEPCYDGNMHLPSATIREEQDGAAVPRFLRHYLIPLLRAGQQLRVLIKFRELCKIAADDHNYVNLLPSWSGFSSYHPTYASSLTFDKVKIDAMVTVRSKFYTSLLINLEHILTKLEIQHQQVVQHDTAPVYAGNLNRPMSATIVEGMASSYIDKKTSISAISAVGSDTFTSADEFSYLVDPLDSSECSSISSSEEENGTEQLFENNSLVGHGPIPISAVSSSSRMHVNDLTHKPPQSNESTPADSLHEMRGSNSINLFGQLLQCNFNEGKYTSHISASLEDGKENMSRIPGTLYEDYYHDMASSLGSFLKYPFHNDREYKNYGKVLPSKHTVKLRNQIMAVLKEGISSTNNDPDNDQVEHEAHASPNALNFQFRRLIYDSKFLSTNPMLTKHALYHLVSEPEETCLRTEYRKLLSCFDFSSVEDPFKIYMKKLDPSPSPGCGVKILQSTDPIASATTVGNSCNDKLAYDETETAVDKCKFIHDTSLDSKVQKAISADISGGSGWERMLAGSDCIANDKVEDYTQCLPAMFEIPLDFIIDKCLLQEIMLQYKYVSKLTMKLLKEGFDLQDHLMALRRYHFMEVADWVDLFITSLWHQKLNFTGSDKGISEIQGLLEISVQGSSCERDHYKDRLFVFIKRQDIIPFSASVIGIHALDFLGLGYRVDWPVSIVLTAAALEIYAEIFNFLLRVKLAIFALTDVWYSMKDIMQATSQGHKTELSRSKVRQINFLMKMRHQVNHFVITLQQYVLSQLSLVSWCRFLHSLKDKVKDMVDFESVHMAYLTESLQICFLSAETHSVARIIENILQCALDFQSCFIQGIGSVGQDQDDSSSILSHVNIEEVLAIKKRFDKELKGLHHCYLKSPKHGDFGLHRFWEYINYNDFYSNDI